MQKFKYRYTDNEIKTLLSTMTVLIDTREQKADHIKAYFDKKNRPFISMKLDTGDISMMLPANPEMNINRDLYFPVAIERKNSVDELAGNIGKERTRFENELIRSKDMDFVLLVEDSNGYKKMLNGEYRSEITPASFVGSWFSFQSRYNFNTAFVDRELSPAWIHQYLYYKTREALKQM